MFREVSLDVLQKQYGYTNISDLMLRKAEVWDKYVGNISQVFFNEILNLDTCVASALDNYWGRIYKLSRTYLDEDNNLITLTDEQFREILKLRAFGISWRGDVLSVNNFLKNIFKDRGICFLRDGQNMTQYYTFYFKLEPWERYLFNTKDILPRPAAVLSIIYELSSDFFGFEGSEFQPFDQAPFFKNN